jgi:internalin A
VLDNGSIEKQLGQFSRNDLRALWSNPIYTGYHIHLLRLMENFQLCYPLPDVRDSYIAPQLLTQDAPQYTWDERENLQLRYAYPIFMPRGILSRAIVKLHQRIEAQRLVWRSGVILHDGYARAEVLELRGEQQIRIRVSGSNKRDLLMEIVRALDELHRGFPKLHFERLVPCQCDTCSQRSEPHFFALDILLERLANRKETIECRYPPYHDVPIQGLLSELSLWEPRAGGRGEMNFYIDGDYHQGDRIEVGDIIDTAGVALGRKAAATVTHRGKHTGQDD